MSNTKAGGQKTKATLLKKYGPDYYHNIGKLGGSSTGGFFKDRDLAVRAGRIGGKRSAELKKLKG